MEDTKTINIFLSGGGVKGSFQAGFLYKLGQWLNLNPNYKIGRIYGSSIGAINGSIFLNNYEHLKLFWDSIKSYKSMTSLWCNIPFIGSLISIIYGFFIKCCLINPINFYKLIRLYCSHNNNQKLNICTTNITNSKIEFIDCSNNNYQNSVVDYIVSSASLWLFSPPILINDNYYADGGIMKFLPIDDNIISQINKNDINLVISAAKNIKSNQIVNKSNLLFYLDYIINMVCDMLYEKDLEKIINQHNFKCYFINQQLLNNISIITFNQNDIKILWNYGIDMCNDFILWTSKYTYI
jgi:predicted patatin/cPLA2 family phospholipase